MVRKGGEKTKKGKNYHETRVDLLLGPPFQLVLKNNVGEAHVLLLADGEQVVRGPEGKRGHNDILPAHLRNTLGGGLLEEGVVILELGPLIDHESATHRVVLVGGQHVTVLVKNREPHAVWMLGQGLGHVKEKVLGEKEKVRK
jgi:hypothetical protein